MKSPLEANPNLLLTVVFIFLTLFFPAILLILRIDFNTLYYGIVTGAMLVIFFFYIYPKISKNKDFLSEMGNANKAAEIIKLQPDLYKVRIVGWITLFLTLSICGICIYENKINYISEVGMLAVFLYMTYYARWMQTKKGLEEYGRKLEKLEEEGFSNVNRPFKHNLILWIAIAIFWLLLWATLRYYFFSRASSSIF